MMETYLAENLMGSTRVYIADDVDAAIAAMAAENQEANRLRDSWEKEAKELLVERDAPPLPDNAEVRGA